MQAKTSGGGKSAESTQKYLNISAVKEDTLVLKDGSVRAVVAVSSTNFSLKSEDEQQALMASYQAFINSLDFPVQILIHSRVLDIDAYLEKLRTLASGQTNELLRIQMNEYIEFVAKLVEFSSIMSKTFYVIVPYSSGPITDSWFSKAKRIFNPPAAISRKQEDFEKSKDELDKRVLHVVSGLSGMGLRSIRLNTEELVELLYMSYNFESGSPLHGEAFSGIEIEDEIKVQQKSIN